MPTSRGAGAAKKGFDYAIYRKGGGVKKLRKAEMPSEIYAEDGGVKKYASGGSVCRGMGSATKGGKYTIR